MDNLNKIVVTDVEGVYTVSSQKGRFENMINRRIYGLSFCKEGQITYIHKGKEYVSDPDHAVILPKGENYFIRGDKSGNFYVINFDCAEAFCNKIVILPVGNVESLIKDCGMIKNLMLFEKNRAKVMSIFYDIIYRLSGEEESGNNVLLPAIKYLEDNYADTELTNLTLANQCNISEVYFRKLFTKQYGITPRQYIIDIRINKAKQLLAEGIMKINAISEECGFSNPYHFCRLFKEKTGMTPTEYIKKNRIFEI